MIFIFRQKNFEVREKKRRGLTGNHIFQLSLMKFKSLSKGKRGKMVKVNYPIIHLCNKWKNG